MWEKRLNLLLEQYHNGNSHATTQQTINFCLKLSHFLMFSSRCFRAHNVNTYLGWILSNSKGEYFTLNGFNLLQHNSMDLYVAPNAMGMLSTCVCCCLCCSCVKLCCNFIHYIMHDYVFNTVYLINAFVFRIHTFYASRYRNLNAEI